MTNREAWNVNRYTVGINGIVTEDAMHCADVKVRLYSDNDLIKVFDNMDDALEWLDKEE